MSGIAGFKANVKTNKKVIQKMIDKISHRGIDDTFFYNDEDVSLGECLSRNNESYSKDLVLILDGNIFNKDELSKILKFKKTSDVEIIIEGYKKFGIDIPKYLRGNFAFVLWDKEKRILFGARDHFGVKPLYYYHNNIFMFASEIKAFLVHPEFKKEFNKDVLGPYLTFNFNPCDETFFKGVFNLNPGHYFIYQENKLKIKKYYELSYKKNNNSKEDNINLIENAVKDAVEIHLKDEYYTGSFLSGGIDSSYLACLAKPNKTFTIDYEERKYSEAHFAKELANSLGIENISNKINKKSYLNVISKIMYHFDEPIADPATVALYFGMESASKEVDVVLSGEGADEFFAGYGIYQDILKFPIYTKIPFCIRRVISNIVKCLPSFKGSEFFIRRGQKVEEWYTGIDWIFKEKEVNKYLNTSSNIKIKDITNKIFINFKEQDDLNKMLAIDTHLFLNKNFLANNDKLSNIFGIDVRTPFVDIKVFEIANQLSFSEKISKQTTKVALREAAKKVIPNESSKRKKLGFPVPLREWIKEDLYYNQIKKTFNTDIAKDLFNNKAIIKLLDDHRNNKKDNYKKVWVIYVFLIWYQEYFN